MNASTEHRAARGLAIARIAVGGWFLKTMITKLSWSVIAVLPVPTASSRWVGFLPARLAEYASTNPIPWYHAFLLNVAIPHSELFAWLTAFGEAAVGIGLVLGLFTEVASGVGLLLGTSYGLATFQLGQCQQGFHMILLGSMAAFIVGRAGRTWGLDGWLADRSRFTRQLAELRV